MHIQLQRDLETEVITCFMSAKKGTKLTDNVHLSSLGHFDGPGGGSTHQIGMKHSEV